MSNAQKILIAGPVSVQMDRELQFLRSQGMVVDIVEEPFMALCRLANPDHGYTSVFYNGKAHKPAIAADMIRSREMEAMLPPLFQAAA